MIEHKSGEFHNHELDTFLVVGGMSGAKYLDTVYLHDAGNIAWALLDVRLSEARVHAVAMLVDRAQFRGNPQC